MNIVKLKDIVMPKECRFSKFFNENLKGKYAYWIKMRYIFPMDSLDYKKYIQYEQLDQIFFIGPDVLPHIDLYDEECNMFNFTQDYIDMDATELANAIADFRTANNYVADADIDINKLRKFRSWLANEILLFNTNLDGEYINNLSAQQLHMLEYYKNDMYNEVVAQLNVFGVEDMFLSTGSGSSSCGCCSNTAGLYKLTNTSVCNALDIYRKNIHNLMVRTFENVQFWMQYNKDFIAVFKRYVDNIIKTGLIISKPDNTALYIKCNCMNDDPVKTILQKLSLALEYIINDEVTGHMNFIHDALYDWADQLYDFMSWELK